MGTLLAGLASVGKWLLDQLTLKTVLILIALAAVGYVGWQGYEWVYDRGVTSQASVIKDLKDKVTNAQAAADQAKKDKDSIQSQFNAFKQSIADNKTTIDKTNDPLVADLTKKLNDSQAKLTSLSNKVKHDLSKYISPANNAACAIPNGFVFLYDKSIQGNPSSPVSTRPSGTNAYAASGISLTQLAPVVLDNNLAAARNRELVLAWQQWYTVNRSTIDMLVAKYGVKAPPKMPEKTPEATPVAPASASSS